MHAALTSSHHMQNTSIALSKEAVAEIKRVAAFTEQTSAKIDALQARVDALSITAGEMKASIASAAAAMATAAASAARNADIQILQLAIVAAKAGDGAFSYQDGTRKSSSIVAETLQYFMRGLGMWISNEYYIRNTGYYNQVTEEEKAAFRDALSIQIHQLTGTKPRIVKEKNGTVEQWVIYRK